MTSGLLAFVVAVAVAGIFLWSWSLARRARKSRAMRWTTPPTPAGFESARELVDDRASDQSEEVTASLDSP